MYKKRLYNIWSCMKQRCTNPKHSAAAYYYHKGIRVCDEWLCFENFQNWALAHGYEEHLTIDRIDSNKDYCPSNCRWITRAENARRVNRKTEKIKSDLCSANNPKGNFMVVRMPREKTFFNCLVTVVAVGLKKTDAIKLSEQLRKENTNKYDYYSRVWERHFVGQLIPWSSLKQYKKKGVRTQ